MLTASVVSGCCRVVRGWKKVKEWEHGNACLYKKGSTELSSGKWNKQSTSHHISPQSLDKTCQIESDSTAVTCINTLSWVYGLNVPTQIHCLWDVFWVLLTTSGNIFSLRTLRKYNMVRCKLRPKAVSVEQAVCCFGVLYAEERVLSSLPVRRSHFPWHYLLLMFREPSALTCNI